MLSPVERVFVLGAGMSLPLGIPLSKDLLPHVLRFLDDCGETQDDLIALLEYLYPPFQSSRTCPNIEDFLALIDVGLHSEQAVDPRLWPKTRLRVIRQELIRAITRYMWSRTPVETLGALDHVITEPWSGMLELVKNRAYTGAAIVTFNWDLTVEMASVLAAREYCYGLGGPEYLQIIKPHGSINWFDNKIVPESDRRFARLGPSLVYYPYFLKGRSALVDETPFVIPPTPFKTFHRPEVKRMWRDTYEGVSSARDIYVIGYSLPPEDQLARLVFIGAIRANGQLHNGRSRIVVIDRNELIVERFRSLAGDDAEVVDGGRSAETWSIGISY